MIAHDPIVTYVAVNAGADPWTPQQTGHAVMNAFRTLLAAAALAASTAAASAAPLTVLNQGESFAVQHDPSYTGNIVGGGFVRTEGNNQTLTIHYSNPDFAHRTAGVPVFTGGSEGTVVYLPSGNAAVLAAR
jgi:hypothetical protein